MGENGIAWELDEEKSSPLNCKLKWQHMRMRVSIKGSVIIYPTKRPGIETGFPRFPDLAALHDSMEQAMNIVLGWFPPGTYEGEVPT